MPHDAVRIGMAVQARIAVGATDGPCVVFDAADAATGAML
jgi:hypothetical protein